MKKMQDIDERDRPREKIRKKGASCLTNQELIAVILGSGGPGRDVRVLAKEISEIIDKSTDASRVQDFALVKGMGSAKPRRSLRASNLPRRILSGQTKTKDQHPCRYPPSRLILSGKKQEHFICITLERCK